MVMGWLSGHEPDAGENTGLVTVWIPAAVPVTVNVNFGVVTSFVGITMVAVFVPAAVGVKISVNVALCPVAMVEGGCVFSVNVAASVPLPIVIVIPERFIASSVFPELASVRMMVLLLPTVVAVNGKLPPELKLVPDASLIPIFGEAAWAPAA
jgi:hypothetical protein